MFGRAGNVTALFMMRHRVNGWICHMLYAFSDVYNAAGSESLHQSPQ